MGRGVCPIYNKTGIEELDLFTSTGLNHCNVISCSMVCHSFHRAHQLSTDDYHNRVAAFQQGHERDSINTFIRIAIPQRIFPALLCRLFDDSFRLDRAYLTTFLLFPNFPSSHSFDFEHSPNFPTSLTQYTSNTTFRTSHPSKTNPLFPLHPSP